MWWYYIQLALVISIALTMLKLYQEFLPDLLKYLLDHLGQTAVLVLLYLIVYSQIGSALGVPYLFWNEEPVTRFFAGIGCTLLLALLGINAYYLIPQDKQIEIMNRIEKFLHHRSVLKLPFGSWLEPRRGNAVELSQFLRTVRFPFLMLLTLPALFPLVFSDVPRYSAVHSNELKALMDWAGQPSLYQELNRLPDVSAHVPAYLIGLAVWVFGLITGVFIIKLGIRVTSLINPLVARLDRIIFPPLRKIARWGRDILGGPTRRPSATRISEDKLNSIITFFVVCFLCYAALSTIFYGSYELGWFKYGGVTSAFAICALMGILAIASVIIELIRPRLRLLVVTIFLVWIGFMNHDQFKLQFENMPNYPPGKPVTLTEEAVRKTHYAPDAQPGALIDEIKVLPLWSEFARKNSSFPSRKPKLAVVCVTGGATRSAYWSTVVLDRLDLTIDPDHPFHNQVRIITGASGGMLGTSYYVKWLYDNHPKANPEKKSVWPSGEARWYKQMPINSLRSVARSLALHETWKMFLPRWGNSFGDRGIDLEKDWYDLRRVSFSDLRPLEEVGEIPSLIFSPMMIDDGRRLIISNVDIKSNTPPPHDSPLHTLTLNRGSSLNGNNDGTKLEPYSVSAVEFFKIFPDASEFRLSTAVRMSGSFPLVSPAVNLPTDPPMRVVDAGYYDNYGVNVAAAWLNLHQNWLINNTSGVVLVQIRDSLSRNDRLGFPEPESDGTLEKALRGFQFFFSPLDAVLKARTTSAMFRNDQAVAAVSDTFTRLTNDRSFFTTVVFENSAEVTVDEAHGNATWELVKEDKAPGINPSSSTTVAMSWYLTQAEVRALENAIPKTSTDQGKTKDREDWISSHAKKVADEPSGTRRREEMQLQLDRARKFDERVQNGERLEALVKWWKEDHTYKRN